MRSEAFYDNVSLILGMTCGIFCFLTAALLVCGIQPFNPLNMLCAVFTSAIAVFCYFMAYRYDSEKERSLEEGKKSLTESCEMDKAWIIVDKLFNQLTQMSSARNFSECMNHASFEELLSGRFKSESRQLVNGLAEHNKSFGGVACK